MGRQFDNLSTGRLAAHDALATRTRTALDALEELARAPFDPAAAGLATQYIGDAIRLAVPWPSALRDWLRSLPSAEFVALTQESLNILMQATADPPSYVRQRDRLESLRIVLRLVTMAPDRAAMTAAAEVLLDGAIREADAALCATMNREELQACLGERRWMLAEADWTAALPLREAELVTADRDTPFALTHWSRELNPPDEAVAAYISDGRASGWLEGAAGASSAFAEQLTSTIDTFRELGEPVSLHALLWRARGSVHTPLLAERRAFVTSVSGALMPSYAVIVPMAAAASTEPLEPRRRVEVLLGRLSPLEAEGRLIGTPGAVELRVTAAPGVVRSVKLGDSEATTADAVGVWVARLDQITAGEVTLEVVGASGERFSTSLSLAPSLE